MFLNKKNKNLTNGNIWNARCTLKAEYIGAVANDILEMLESLMFHFPFLGWSGKYAFDPRGDFHLRHACERLSLEDSRKN